MEPFRFHVFVCDQQKPEGVPCCAARGSRQVVDALRAEVAARGLAGQVQITLCGSLGLCERGPNMVWAGGIVDRRTSSLCNGGRPDLSGCYSA